MMFDLVFLSHRYKQLERELDGPPKRSIGNTQTLRTLDYSNNLQHSELLCSSSGRVRCQRFSNKAFVKLSVPFASERTRRFFMGCEDCKQRQKKKQHTLCCVHTRVHRTNLAYRLRLSPFPVLDARWAISRFASGDVQSIRITASRDRNYWETEASAN